MNRRMVVGVVAVAALLCALMPGLAQAGTLDQQQTSNSGGGQNVSPGFSDAQTFTAGIAGNLDQVDLHLYAVPPLTAPLTVQIRNAPGGLIGDTVFATGSIGPAGVGIGPGGLVPVVFGSPPGVVAGTLYAIVVYTTSPGGAYNWGFSNTNPYSGGQAFQSSAGVPFTGTSFTTTAVAGDDFAFRTYVAPPATAKPTGLRAAALKKCKKKKSKKARKKCRKRALKLPV